MSPPVGSPDTEPSGTGSPDLEPRDDGAGVFDRGVSWDPVVGPSHGRPDDEKPVAVPRLARHEIVLDDSHRVGVAVSGRGLPVVLVHGFTAEGILYAQTLSRLVRMGFKVIAVDVAGHGGTQGLPSDGANIDAYVDLLARVVDDLGVRRAVFAGHSMGGRLVAQLAARDPQRAVAVVLIDATVGDAWDRLIGVSRFVPPVLVGVGLAAVIDTLSTLPLLRDRRQAAKLGRLVAPTVRQHVVRPWRLFGPAVSLVRSRPSAPLLESLARDRVPVVVIHGDRDLVVPYRTALDTARRARAVLVTVRGGTHSWVLKDPETLPAIVAELLEGPLAPLRSAVTAAAGLTPGATTEQVEDVFLEPRAKVRRLTPAVGLRASPLRHRRPRYRWLTTAREA
jgi:pimeloyl-ACP methyl ester carboxylesterase